MAQISDAVFTIQAEPELLDLLQELCNNNDTLLAEVQRLQIDVKHLAGLALNPQAQAAWKRRTTAEQTAAGLELTP